MDYHNIFCVSLISIFSCDLIWIEIGFLCTFFYDDDVLLLNMSIIFLFSSTFYVYDPFFHLIPYQKGIFRIYDPFCPILFSYHLRSHSFFYLKVHWQQVRSFFEYFFPQYRISEVAIFFYLIADILTLCWASLHFYSCEVVLRLIVKNPLEFFCRLWVHCSFSSKLIRKRKYFKTQQSHIANFDLFSSLELLQHF